MRAEDLEIIAAATHEANRAYCIALGDTSQVSWGEAPEWQRSSAVNGVRGALAGNTPEQSHESWTAEKIAAGWKYGAVKDPDRKTHPCLVPYRDLPPEHQCKDAIFVSVARSMARVLNLGPAGVSQ